MKHIITFLLVLSTLSSAQVMESLDSLDSKFALQMQIQRDFNFTGFGGSGLAGKYHFSGDWALRCGVNFNFQDVDSNTKRTENDLTSTSYQDDQGYSFALAAILIHYITLQYDVSFFVGAGPSFLIVSNEGERKKSIISDSSHSINTDNIDHYNFGIELNAGVEWFVRKNIGIHAEYVLTGYVQNREQESIISVNNGDDRTVSTTEITTWNFRNSAFRLGVSIYF